MSKIFDSVSDEERALWTKGDYATLKLLGQMAAEAESEIETAQQESCNESFDQGRDEGHDEGFDEAWDRAGKLADRHRMAIELALSQLEGLHGALVPLLRPQFDEAMMALEMVADELADFDAFQSEKSVL
jgi:flagellar biosynthesis/type III secretory pathway protein FliH